MYVTGYRLPVFINLSNLIKELPDTLSLMTHSRYNRNSKELAQRVKIKNITLIFKLIIHIKCNNHLHPHINKLGSKIEISLNIGGINYVDNDVRFAVENIIPDVDLFG